MNCVVRPPSFIFNIPDTEVLQPFYSIEQDSIYQLQGPDSHICML
jgi:hypothetical protein